MENFDSLVFRNAVQAMTEAQAMAPGEELLQRGQDSEYAEWVQAYGGDTVRGVRFFLLHIRTDKFLE